MPLTIDDRVLLGLFDVPDPDCLVVETPRDLQDLCDEILGQREHAVVGLTLDTDGVPVLGCAEVRAVVGTGVRIYVIGGEELLARMRETLGPRLALTRGALRVWWPGARRRCDASEHPVVLALEDEPREVRLGEFALQFDLSRRHVRKHVELIEDARALLEHELACVSEQARKLHERLRDTQIDCHSWRTRAEQAEAELAARRRQPDRRLR